MVDVSAKHETTRSAAASARVVFSKIVLAKVVQHGTQKGDLFATARIAGIQAAKRCSELIPLCHPLPLSHIKINLEQVNDTELAITAVCKTSGKTGVEMEALTAASVAALTIYDMCKGLDKAIVIESVQLDHKEGGDSGEWVRR